MARQRIAVAMIVGDGVTEQDWTRLVASVEGEVEGIWVTWTGAGEPPAYLADRVVRRFAWTDDFAAARNASFAAVPEGSYDWLLWLDHDDTLEHADQLQPMLASLKPETISVWLRYAYAWDETRDAIGLQHPRERMFRADAVPSWLHPVHEVALNRPGTQHAHRDDVWVRHWRVSTPEADAVVRARNRRIVARAYREHPKEPRYVLLMANELMAEAHLALEAGDPDAAHEARHGAAKLYRDFLALAPLDDDAYVANHRLAELLRLERQHDEAINQDLQGVKMRPTWAESWVGVAQCFLEVGDYAHARDFAELAIRMAEAPPVTVQAYDPDTYEFTPFLIRGVARGSLGDDAGAIADFEHCLAYRPGDAQTTDLLAQAQRRVAMKLQPNAASAVRAKRRGTKPERSIAFVTQPLFEPWGPRRAAADGCGGAEQCVIELAARFARDGWRVAVFGTPGDERGVADGVEWWDSGDFEPSEPFSVVVSSRAPQVFDAPVAAAKKVLWMHDVNVGDTHGNFGDPMRRADVVVGLTRWHQEHLRRVYGIPKQRTAAIANGYDPSLFRSDLPSGRRQRRKYVWASSPDRGIDTLIGLWPEIRRRLPGAELHVFYGWTGIDKLLPQLAPNDPMVGGLGRFKERLMKEIVRLGGELGGLHWHDRKPRSELARVYPTCDAWLYPTTFCETFCITAVEMQACGVLPLTSALGALNETVAVPGLRLPGAATSPAYHHAYLDRLVALDEASEDERREWRAVGAAHAQRFTWDAAYADWTALLERL